MAKWGEGDPRWIVEEREDAKNVNNWHWTEKDCSQWTKDVMPEFFKKVPIIDDKDTTLEITKLNSVAGEVSANLRKGKVFFLYDLEVKLRWTGKHKGIEATGTIECPEVSQETPLDSFEVIVRCDDENLSKNEIKDLVRKAGSPVVRKRMAVFIDELAKANESMALPTPATGGKLVKQPTKSPASQDTVATSPSKPKAEEEGKASKIKFSNIEMNVDFSARCSDIYETLLDPQRVQAFTQSASTVTKELNKQFSLFGGSITAYNVELVPNEKIVQKWRAADWPEGHFSTVTIKLKSEDNGTKLSLKQVEVPSNDLARTETNWHNYYWQRIKMVFGYGYNIYGNS